MILKNREKTNNNKIILQNKPKCMINEMQTNNRYERKKTKNREKNLFAKMLDIHCKQSCNKCTRYCIRVAMNNNNFQVNSMSRFTKARLKNACSVLIWHLTLQQTYTKTNIILNLTLIDEWSLIGLLSTQNSS